MRTDYQVGEDKRKRNELSPSGTRFERKSGVRT